MKGAGMLVENFGSSGLRGNHIKTQTNKKTVISNYGEDIVI